MTPFVAVYDSKYQKAIHAPGYDKKTWDWRALPGSETNTAKVLAYGKTHELLEALHTRWSTDAHMTAYVMSKDGQIVRNQPRLSKDALPWVQELGYSVTSQVLICDIDNDNHETWTPDSTQKAIEQAQTIEAFRMGIWYFTARGRRLIHVLHTPIPVQDIEPFLIGWLDELERQGIRADRNCKDWTRMFRLPWVVRDDGYTQQFIPWVDGYTLRDAPTPCTTKRVAISKQPSTPIQNSDIQFSDEIPQEFAAKIPAIAEAIRTLDIEKNPEWHSIFMGVAGALLERGVPADIIPAINKAISEATQADTKTKDRVVAAKTTIKRHVNGQPYIGYQYLLKTAPAVAFAIDRTIGHKIVSPQELQDIETIKANIRQAIYNAPEGAIIISTGCGTGKTQTAIQAALALASQEKPVKVAISEPTNEMAKQVYKDILAAGGRALRVFSPASEINPETGKPFCHYAEQAKALAGCGISIPWDLCLGRMKAPCPHYDTCPASKGIEGDEKAHILVTNHKLMHHTVNHSGVNGIRIIDEPPPPVESHVIPTSNILASKMLHYAFTLPHYEAIRPVLDAMLSNLERGKAPILSSELVTPEMRATITEAWELTREFIRWPFVQKAREDRQWAAELAKAAACISIARRFAIEEPHWTYTTLNNNQHIRLTHISDALSLALRTEGRAVILDARPNVPALSIAAGYDLSSKVIHAEASDRSTIQRTYIRWSTSGKKRLMPGKSVNIDKLAYIFSVIMSWIEEDPRCKKVGIITHMAIQTVIDAWLGLRDREEMEEWWEKNGYSPPLEDIIAHLNHTQATDRWLKYVAMTGHYGAIRGLDKFKEADALITIGDPWPNLLHARHVVQYLQQLAETLNMSADSYSVWAARSELEQAHGRLRTIYRDRPGRALHVGGLVPTGASWATYEERKLLGGRCDTACNSVELLAKIVEKLGSTTITAEALGVSKWSIQQYLKGQRRVPYRLKEPMEAIARKLSIPFTDPPWPSTGEEEESVEGLTIPQVADLL